MITLVAAMSASDRVIGRDGDLPWRLPGDLKRFKAATMGHPIVMGRTTYESIGRPLPGRTNIVLTRNADRQFDGCVTVTSLDDALAAAADAPGGDEAMIIGGATLYEQLLPRADRMILTLVEGCFEGDTFYPAFDDAEWAVVEATHYPADDKNAWPCTVQKLARRPR